MTLFSGLIDAAPDQPATAVAKWQQLRSGPDAGALGSLLVADRELMALDRAVATELPVTVINTGGAGGLVALAGRQPQRLRIVAVDNTVRDPQDPVGNIARIASAARELDPEIGVRVDIPYGCNRYEQAVAEAEAEELQALLTFGGDTGELVGQLGAFVEADLSFAASIDGPGGLIGLLTALDAIIDGATVVDAERLFGVDDLATTAAGIAGWDEQRIGRIRRRLTSVRTADTAGLLDQLTGWGLLT